jgi:hypothetical protein
MKTRSWALHASLILLLVAASARAQVIDTEHGHAGAFVVGIDQRIGGSIPAATQRQEALVIAGKLREILQRDRAISTPIGYSIRINPVFGRVTDWADFDSGLPFFAGAVGSYFAADSKPSPTSFRGPDFGIYANTVLQCPLQEFSPPNSEGKKWHVNGNLPVLQGGRRTGEFQGHPIYDKQCVIIGRRSEPPFIPLTREQFVQLRIATLKERLDSLKKKFSGQSLAPAIQAPLESAYQLLDEQIRQQEQQLAAMDAAERSAPAAVSNLNEEGTLVGADEEGAFLLSIPNPAFYDRSLPASTVQSIAVYLPFLQEGDRPAQLPPGLPDDWRPASEKIRDQLDWAALANLVK